MFKTGALLWIPQGSTILSPTPNAPKIFMIIDKPNIGLYVGKYPRDNSYSFIMVDGQKWAIQDRQIKHYRRSNVGKINRNI